MLCNQRNITKMFLLDDRAERHDSWSGFLLIHSPSLLSLFLGGKGRGENNTQSRGQKSCLISARSFWTTGLSDFVTPESGNTNNYPGTKLSIRVSLHIDNTIYMCMCLTPSPSQLSSSYKYQLITQTCTYILHTHPCIFTWICPCNMSEFKG